MLLFLLYYILFLFVLFILYWRYSLLFFQNPANRPDFDVIVEQCLTVIDELKNTHNQDVNDNEEKTHSVGSADSPTAPPQQKQVSKQGSSTSVATTKQPLPQSSSPILKTTPQQTVSTSGSISEQNSSQQNKQLQENNEVIVKTLKHMLMELS